MGALSRRATVRDQGSFYITTPIYYVNGMPHIGHAYTTIVADVASRWQRLKGRRVCFLTGTDEHGQKVMDKALERGMDPKAHCDDMVTHWKAMWERLDIAYDHFVRTTDPYHVLTVKTVLQRLYDEGFIYRAEYEGWYYVRDEIFVTDKDVEAGLYPQEDLQRITESNYFFKMGSFQQQLISYIEANPDFIQPSSRRNEVLGFLRKELGDLCISRPKSRMSWGIDLPFDTDYVTYVWFDALLNYLSAIGYDNDLGQDWKSWWPGSFHLVGKDILTTHSVYWSTMLMAMGVPLVDCLYAHGWWTSTEGEKIGKSAGNAIDIGLLVDEFGVDATRYFFSREIAFGADGKFSYEGFLARYNADLANDLGNMAHRGLSMTRNWFGGAVPARVETEAERALDALATQVLLDFDQAMGALQIHRALERLWELVRAGNKYIDTQQPWALRKSDPERAGTVLRTVLELACFAATLLQPIMPGKSAELLSKLGQDVGQARKRCCAALNSGSLTLDGLREGAATELGDALFPRFRELPQKITALFVQDEPEPKKKKSKQKKKAPAGPISFDDFMKVQLRAGRILSGEPHPDADKLLVLKVDLGEEQPRQIVAGIAKRYRPEELLGKQVVVVANLAPATIRGVESQGMILAAGADEVVGLVAVDAAPGEIVR